MWQGLAAGRRFGPYELNEELGRGGSAVVYRAFDTSRQRDVAVKVMAPIHALDDSFRARFRQEAEVIARLVHPHVLKVLDSGQGAYDDPALPADLAYLVTEYMAGGSLSEQLSVQRDPALRAQIALVVAQHIGEALDWAHGAGVLHRDVKPSNVLISADGRFVLGDFGLARVLQGDASLNVTITGTVAGTPAYMAPEQALGEPADSRTDLYGLAVVLYEVVTGHVPFTAETPLATMLAHVHQPVPPADTPSAPAPAAISAVLLRALAKSREDRYQSGRDLSAALREAVAAVYGESQIVTGVYPLVPLTRPLAEGAAAASDHPPRRGAPPLRSAAPVRRRRPWSLPLRVAASVALVVAGGAATAGATLAVGPARPALARLVTRLATDATQPRVERILPPVTKNPTLRPSFHVIFNVKMEQESVERAMRFDPPVPLDFEWIDTAVVVTPRVDLELASWYTLIIDRTAIDIEGRPLASDSRTTYRSIAEAPTGRGTGLAAPLTLVLTPTAAPGATGGAGESRDTEASVAGSEDAAATRPPAAATPTPRTGNARLGQSVASTPLPLRPSPSLTRRAALPTIAPSPVPATPAPGPASLMEEQLGTTGASGPAPEPGLPATALTPDAGRAPAVTPTLSVTPATPAATATPVARPTGTARPTVDPVARATSTAPSPPAPTPTGPVSSAGAASGVATSGASPTPAPGDQPSSTTRTAGPGPTRTPAAGAAAVSGDNAASPTVIAGSTPVPVASNTRSTASLATPTTQIMIEVTTAILPTATTPRSTPAGAG